MRASDRAALIGGDAVLDFVNTISWRGDIERRLDRLASYDQFLVWAARAELIDTDGLATLARLAGAKPAVAKRAIAAALAFREEIHDFLVGLLTAENPTYMPLSERIIKALQHAELRGAPARWHIAITSVDAPADLLALQTLDLLQSSRLRQLRACENGLCGWLFLDRSRNRSRRWCSSTDCGNRERASRHYARHRAPRENATGH